MARARADEPASPLSPSADPGDRCGLAFWRRDFALRDAGDFFLGVDEEDRRW